MNSEKSKVKRIPKRGYYNRDKVYVIMDRHYIAHVGFIYKGEPVVIPTMYGRDGDVIYLHGAVISRLLNELEKGAPMSLSIAGVTGLVLAKSAFSHSLNYESVVVFGKASLVHDSQKEHALQVISEHLIRGRWDEVRKPSKQELAATKVIAIKIDEVSAKIRDEGVNETKKDVDLPIWSGIVPVIKHYDTPISTDSSPLPDSVKQLLKPS